MRGSGNAVTVSAACIGACPLGGADSVEAIKVKGHAVAAGPG